MPIQVNETNDERQQKPEVKNQPNSKQREKEVPTSQQSSNEPEVEKSVVRQRRTEVQNPLMHESY